MSTTRPSRGRWRPAPRNATSWKEIRQAARVARSEGVAITLRNDGSTVVSALRPALDDSKATSGDRRASEKTKHGSSNSGRTATAGESARERREQRAADRQRASQERIAAQAAPPPAAAPPQPEPPQPEPPTPVEPDYPAMWQRFNAPYLWRVRNERMYEVVREHRLAVMPERIPLATELRPTRSPGAAGLTTPSPSRSRQKSRRGKKQGVW